MRPRSSSSPTLSALLPVLLAALLSALLSVGFLQSPASAATTRTVTLKAATTGAVAGSSVGVSGVVTKSPKGSTVTIQRKSGNRWITAKTTRTTTAAGAFRARVTLPARNGTSSYRAFVAARGALRSATSPVVRISALTRVTATAKASPARLVAGASTVVSGTVKPFVAGTVVTVQRFSGRSWSSTGVTAVVSSRGTFARSVPIRTSSILRVSVPRAGSRAPAVSGVTTVLADPAISSTSLPDAAIGLPYTAQLAQVGSDPGTWAVSPALPAGLKLAAPTGRITGTPTTQQPATAYTFTFAQPGLKTASKVLTLAVVTPQPPTISTNTLPQGRQGTAYSSTLTADGNPTGTWSVTAGALPASLTLAPTTGVISGTPTASGTSSFTVTFTQTGTELSSSKQLSITILPPPGPSITTTSLPDAKILSAYSATVTVTGGIPGTWSATGLPTGLKINASTGLISGTVGLQLPGVRQVIVTYTPTDTSIAPATATLPLKVSNAAPA